MIDYARFETAYKTVTSLEDRRGGIGTLGEKAVHAVLKYYYEPNEALHEVKCGDFVADVLSYGHIFEIQSRGFEKLIPKLAHFLEQYEVTVVFPISVRKEIVWVDPETGECRKPRVSNKHGNALDLFPELYRIRSFLTHPRLHIRVMLMNVTEYRLTDGQGKDRKQHASKIKRIPEEFLREIAIDCREDYLGFLPKTLPQTFTVDTLSRESGANLRSAGAALRILRELRLIDRIGKEKRKYLYSAFIQNS